jgi:hypothetical protein
MVEQWSPKPKVKGSNPFSPEENVCARSSMDRVPNYGFGS